MELCSAVRLFTSSRVHLFTFSHCSPSTVSVIHLTFNPKSTQKPLIPLIPKRIVVFLIARNAGT